MPWWAWTVGGVVAWVYLGFVAWRWDQYDNSEPLFIGCLLLWCIVFIAQSNRPRRPWLAWEPRLAASERRAAAEKRSLELEREAGLEFNGVFLLPGYRDERRNE